jgi:hypothetical protein
MFYSKRPNYNFWRFLEYPRAKNKLSVILRLDFRQLSNHKLVFLELHKPI